MRFNQNTSRFNSRLLCPADSEPQRGGLIESSFTPPESTNPRETGDSSRCLSFLDQVMCDVIVDLAGGVYVGV